MPAENELIIEWIKRIAIAAVVMFGFYRGFKAAFRKKKKPKKKKS